MDSRTDRHRQFVAPSETQQITGSDRALGSRQLLRLLIIYVPLEFILALALAAAVQAQSTAEQLLQPYVTDYGPQYRDVEDATIAFRNRNFAESRRLLQQAKKQHPQLPPADILQARLFMAAKRGKEALDSLERAVAADPTDPEAYLFMAELALRQRQVTLADLAFQKASVLVDKYTRNKHRLRQLKIRSLAGLATMGQLRGLPDQTIANANAWIALDRKNAQPHRLMGRAYFEQKKYKEAFTALQAVAKLDPKGHRAEILLANLYEGAGLRDVAKQTMELAEKNGAKEPKTRLAIAEWALGAGLLDMAKSNVQAAQQLDTESVPAGVLAGRIARQQRDHKTAEAILQDAVTRSPGSFTAVNQLALCLAASEDEAKRRRGLEYAHMNLRTHGGQNTSAAREAAITLAWLMFQQGREAEAEKAIAAVIRKGSISSESAFYVAKILSHRGKSAIAAQILKPILELKRSFPQQTEARELLESLAPAGGIQGS